MIEIETIEFVLSAIVFAILLVVIVQLWRR